MTIKRYRVKLTAEECAQIKLKSLYPSIQKWCPTSSPFLILIYKLVLPMYDVGPIPSRSRTWLDEQGAQHCSCRSRIARC